MLSRLVPSGRSVFAHRACLSPSARLLPSLRAESHRWMCSSPAAANIRLENNNGVGVITLDVQGSKMNTLSDKLQPEFEKVFAEASADPNVKAIVITSGKPDNFIAGADITMLAKCKTAAAAQKISADAQKMMNMIESSSKPVVAAIHGPCLGGGLELAMACHWRVASEHPSTALGLPEVQLGLLPGAGGTQRLPRLVGMAAALDLMLTGKRLDAKRASRMGLVQQVADPYALLPAAVQTALSLAAKTTKVAERKPNLMHTVMEKTGPGRDLMFNQVTKTLQAKTGGHYPAPFKIAEAARTGLEKGMNEGLRVEAEEFGKLSQTPQAAALMSIFFASTALKTNRFGKPEKPARNIAVLGAGLMGAGIAQVTIAKDPNARVVLYDTAPEGIARGMKQIHDDFKPSVKRKKMTQFEVDSRMSQLFPVLASDADAVQRHMANCDLIIEAVPESLALKHKVLGGLEKIVPPHCVIASNTSALPIGDVARGLTRPERLLGMHYFSPVPKMPLLEIITTDKTSKDVAALAVEVGLKQGKTVIVVKDGPGFYTTRILAPMMSEAVTLLLEGVSLEDLDRSLKKFGFPVGPVTLVDEVGVDVGYHVSHDLGAAFGARFSAESESKLMDQMIKAGFLGRKSGRGFYVYDSTKKSPLVSMLEQATSTVTGKRKGKEINKDVLALLPKQNVKVDLDEMNHRMVLRMVNEAVMCLQEGILPNATEGDIGAIFGLGFPPFLGGPFRYVDQIGAARAVELLEGFEKRFGQRFTPAALLKEHARTGKLFHPKME